MKTFDYLIINLTISDLIMIIPNCGMAIVNCVYGKWWFDQGGTILIKFYVYMFT